MNALTSFPVDTAPIADVVVMDDDDAEIAAMQRHIDFLSGIYRRRLLPTAIAVASVLGTIVVVAQLAKWIAR